MNTKKLIILFIFFLNSCLFNNVSKNEINTENNNTEDCLKNLSLKLSNNKVGFGKEIEIEINAENKCNYPMDYRIFGNKGVLDESYQSESNTFTNQKINKKFKYIPFEIGNDNIKVEIIDITNQKIAELSEKLTVLGTAITYITNPENTKFLEENKNYPIKITYFEEKFQKVQEISMGRNPTISPDKNYISYIKFKEDGKSSQLIIKNLNNGKENILIDDNSLNKNPSWLTEESGNLSLVFSSNRLSSNFNLWKVSTLKKELNQLTNENGNEYEADCSSDGKLIVFTSDLDKNELKEYRNLFLLNLKGNNIEQVTFEKELGSRAFRPVWSNNNEDIFYSRKFKKEQFKKIVYMQKIWKIDIKKEKGTFGNIITRAFDETIIEDYPSSIPFNNNGLSYLRKRYLESSLIIMNLNEKIELNWHLTPRFEIEQNNISEIKWVKY